MLALSIRTPSKKCIWTHLFSSEISGSHRGEYEDESLLGYIAVWRRSWSTFRKRVLPPSSGRTSETSVSFNDTTRRYIPEWFVFTCRSYLKENASHMHHTCITCNIWLMLFREIISVYFENHMKPIQTYTMCGQNCWLLKQMVHILSTRLIIIKLFSA
jgi:hypothetical protein